MRIVLTRPPHRAKALAGILEEEGHVVRCVPLLGIIDLEPFPDPSEFDGVLFTSVNAVERAPFDVKWPRVGSVGPATTAALEQRGVDVAVTGSGGGAELAEAWGDCEGQRLLLPQAEGAHPALRDALAEHGAVVTAVAVYMSVPLVDVDAGAFADADVICFFAPSQVAAFRDLGVETNAKYCAYGPTTLAAMEGLAPIIDTDDLFAD